jgi:hypothetical protein
MEKNSRKVFHPAIKEAFSVSDFNMIDADGLPFGDFSEALFSIEGPLCDMFESPAAPILQRIVETRTLELTSEERFALVKFIAIQWARVPGRFHQIKETTRRALPSLPIPKSKMRPLGKVGDGEDQFRDPELFFMAQDALGLASVLQRANLYLHELKEGEFIFGDNPVIVLQRIDIPTNLAVHYPVSAAGALVFLPISPEVGLHLETPLNANEEPHRRLGQTYRDAVILKPSQRDRLNQEQIANALSYLGSRSGIFPEF